jgi:UDP-2,4-diacetamido-2,4,6-trideoxy-beta-L-altropyranose hydrolase
MRCLTLADALRERGADCTFVCRLHTGHLLDLIAQRGHKAVVLPALRTDEKPAPAELAHAAWLGTDWTTDAAAARQALGDDTVDWLVVDHYALDHRWEQALRPNCKRLMVIDDLADRPHDCNLLLDQNLGRTAEDYSGLLSPHVTILIGPQYALLRPEFAQLRAKSLARRVNPQFRHLLIAMGGVDKDNATGQVLNALRTCHLPPDLHITVVMGPHAPWLQQVQAQAVQMPLPTQVLVGVSNMAQLMVDSDLAIGAAGSTSWERCCLGLPSFLLVLAQNQKDIGSALSRAGAVYVSRVEDIDKALLKLFEEFASNPAALLSMSEKAAVICDGQGATRVSGGMIEN